MLEQADVAIDKSVGSGCLFLVLNDIAGKESVGEIGSLHAKTPVFLPRARPWPDVCLPPAPALASALDLAEQSALCPHPIRPLPQWPLQTGK